MAHESFEDSEAADILNKYFVSVKVDREQRPDVDGIYMDACQAFTGSGGWPMSVFMTPEQKPFFAGTYYPKDTFMDLCESIANEWSENRGDIEESADRVVEMLNRPRVEALLARPQVSDILQAAVEQFKHSFDEVYGGFGSAPKFPTPHNLIFLLEYGDEQTIEMAEKTLIQMYKGGIFDHIGYGFSRYSTDRYWLVPHFEKMLYDNALLTLAYLKAFEVTGNKLYKDVAVKTMEYVSRELTSPEGGFYCAQDADSDGVEGKFYVFDYDEIADEKLKNYFDITKHGNFEGKNIPNLIKNDHFENIDVSEVYKYRKTRTKLHRDEKILPSWNALMIAAFANAYRVLKEEKYLRAAEKAISWQKSDILLLDDYSFYIYALIQMYEATQDEKYLAQSTSLCDEAVSEFWDDDHGGFFIYGTSSEQLIAKPKETYDGAIPSGNAVMTYNLIKLARLNKSATLADIFNKQLDFMSASASAYPMGHSFFLLSLLLSQNQVTFEDCSNNVCHRVKV